MKTKIVRVVTVEQPVEKKILDNSREIIEERPVREHVCTTSHDGDGTIGPQDCTEMDVQTFHVTLTYKPRI